MICDLVEVPEDVEELQLFKGFHMDSDFPVVVGQLHVIRGLLQDESLNDNLGISHYSELLDGKPSSLI